MQSYFWLCYYLVSTLSHSPAWDYYILWWFVIDFALISIVVGVTVLALFPSAREKVLGAKPEYYHRHRRPEGVKDPLIAELVKKRRDRQAGINEHKEMQHAAGAC